jgi:hypothetical protein
MKNILYLIPATDKEEDCKLLFDIRNELSVRELSLNKDELIYTQHERWYKNNFESVQIIMLDNTKIGYVRTNDGYISIGLRPEYRNKGYGSEVLKQVKGKAIILFENQGSYFAFKKAGWTEKGYYFERN